jgi:hypothetical protein
MSYYKSKIHFKNCINKIIESNKDFFEEKNIKLEDINEQLDLIYRMGYASKYSWELKNNLILASKSNILYFIKNIRSKNSKYKNNTDILIEKLIDFENNKEYNNFCKDLDCPGVYLFFTDNDKYLYIGKSKCLRNRIPSSYNLNIKNYNGNVYLKVIKTINDNDAGILEQYLICKLYPLFNKADKFKEETTLIISNIPEFSKSIKLIKKI